jgi:death-on-curing protein
VSSQNEPTWLEGEIILAIHEQSIADHGGALGIRDRGLLESALARPLHAAHYEEPTLATLGALYAIGIVKNHPFVDGNKRVGFAAMETFIRLNGAELVADDATCVVRILALAAGEQSEAEFIAWVNDATRAAR